LVYKSLENSTASKAAEPSTAEQKKSSKKIIEIISNALKIIRQTYRREKG
jgi:hypothetical protein